MPNASGLGESSYYDILQLPRTASNKLSSEDVKTAYHRALLLHHPDKAKDKKVDLGSSTQKRHITPYSIDEILIAYQTLSNPVSRTAYDENLDHKKSLGLDTSTNEKGIHIGVETVDLEEMDFDEHSETWCRSCRCGDERGYIVTEEDLERESARGEIYLGCEGCSLFLKVLFSPAEPEAQT